jgi:DNA uptake protein ComE-like DNA-binding protein
MPNNYTPLTSFFSFTNGQKKGLLLLFLIILVLQCVCFFGDFQSYHYNTKSQQWLSLQIKMDSFKAEKPTTEYQIYPYNPNFITDFKGYKLGMNSQEIQKLLAFRKSGRYVNSAADFQAVTGVSDSLLQVISPFFKFPDWVSNPQKNTTYQNNKWKQYPKKEPLKVKDINQATKEDLMAVYGIGDAISDRILNQKALFGAFASMDQMEDIWGLSPEVIKNLNTYFKINATTSIKKININSASIKELGAFPYFKYPISKNIVVYRSMNGDIKTEDLSKIKNFPVDKLEIIVLYLEF